MAAVSIDKRFWSKVERASQAACWPWRAFRDRDGYGKFRLGGRCEYAHRVAYSLARGPVAADQVVMHSCDNRACCNPAHLRAGTQLENVEDRQAKARQARGGRNGRARLSGEQVLEIRWRHRMGQGVKLLAGMFGSTPAAVRDVVNGRNWRHLGSDISPRTRNRILGQVLERVCHTVVPLPLNGYNVPARKAVPGE